MKNNGTVNLVNNDFFVSGGTGEPKLGGYTIDNGYMWHDNMYHYYYPIYDTVRFEKSKVDIAFKILKSLFENKLLEEVSVEKFVKLVSEIADNL
jgi:hypothetical protein